MVHSYHSANIIRHVCPHTVLWLILMSKFLMQRHISCICRFFLKSEFSYVSSNSLAVQMQSCIDCIWTIFHLREFSDVSSNCLPQQMQSRIDCICTLFLQIAFSYVSNHLLVTKFIKLILHLLHLLHLEEGQHPHFFAPPDALIFHGFSSEEMNRL